MRLDDAEDLWLACVCQAPKYADHSLVTERHLSPRAKAILEEIRRVVADGWPMVAPDQIQGCNLRTIPRRMDAVDAETTLPQAEKVLLEAWANAEYKRALQQAIEVCDERGRHAAELHLADIVSQLQANSSGLHWKKPADVAREILDEIRRSLTEDAPKGLGSGMEAIDRACAWWPPARMTTIGGWTNEGKSTLALELCTGMSIRGIPTAIISLEDEEKIMVKRQLAMCTAELAAVQRLNDRETTEADVDLFHEVVKELLDNLPQQLTHLPDPEVPQVCHAIQDAARNGARVVVVDYLQCFDAEDGQKRSEALGRAARKMKAAAARVGAHLILVSQVRRPKDAEARKNPPSMFMFKESGDIENQTEYALLVWRPGKGSKAAVERALVLVEKAKDGEPGTIELGWDRIRALFTLEPPDDADRGQREIGDGGYTYSPD